MWQSESDSKSVSYLRVLGLLGHAPAAGGLLGNGVVATGILPVTVLRFVTVNSQ